jgi:WD40 repeat protein
VSGLYLRNNVRKFLEVFIHDEECVSFFLNIFFSSSSHVKGHSKAVWTIISIGDVTNNSNIILTGGADNVILAWKNQNKIQTYEGE